MQTSVSSYSELDWFNVLITMLQNRDTKLENIMAERESHRRLSLSGKYVPLSLQVSVPAVSRPLHRGLASSQKQEGFVHLRTIELGKKRAGELGSAGRIPSLKGKPPGPQLAVSYTSVAMTEAPVTFHRNLSLKQTHRHREQTGRCRGRGWGARRGAGSRERQGVWG